MNTYIPDSKGKMMSLNLHGLWIITNYPVFRAAMQLPLSGGISTSPGNRILPEMLFGVGSVFKL